MCSYLSFFKQNTFHIHLSDNIVFDEDVYSKEYAIDNFYAAFRAWSDDPTVEGLNTRANESYTRSEFDNIQQQCARRGVTVIPEIEVPAHSLIFTKWKPELGLEDASMLNLSNPDTAPVIQSVFKTFLPWFHSKVVHIGADEYDSSQVDVYAKFVDEMNDFIRKESPEHTVRLWGTFTPTQGCNVSRELSYQHWSFSMDNPYWDYLKNGYDVLNSDEEFYMVGKGQFGYPFSVSKHKIFQGRPGGGPYAPYIFDTTNALNNPSSDNPQVLGHVAALWNDYGPNATSVLEAYHAWRGVLPAFGNIQWGGELKEDEYDSAFEKLHPAIPGQNLDRRVPSQSYLVLQYVFNDTDSSKTVKDSSGNGYDGILHGCEVRDSTLHLSDDCYLETPLGSKGRNYTLSFSVKPTSSAPGALFEGPDSSLVSGNGTTNNVTMITGGNAYELDYSLPLDNWTDVSLVGKGMQTCLRVSSKDESEPKTMEFQTLMGIMGTQMVSAQIGIEAPLATIGKGFVGMMKNIELRDGGSEDSS